MEHWPRRTVIAVRGQCCCRWILLFRWEGGSWWILLAEIRIWLSWYHWIDLLTPCMSSFFSLPIGSSFWFVLATVSCLMLGNLATRRNQNSWCLKMPWCWLRLVRFSQNRDHPKIHQNTYLKRTLQKNHQNTCVINSEYQADTSELCGQVGMALIAKGHLASRCRVSRVLNWVLHPASVTEYIDSTWYYQCSNFISVKLRIYFAMYII